MNTPNTTPDIAETARKVLRAAQKAALLVYSEEHDAAMDHFVTCAHAAPDLASAVERGLALADRLDAEAERMGSHGGAFTARAFAAEIRTPLNGEANA